MFPPSLQNVLASATHAHHYEIIGGAEPKLIASGPEDSALMLAAMSELRWYFEAQHELEALRAKQQISVPAISISPAMGALPDALPASPPDTTPQALPEDAHPLSLQQLVDSHLAQVSKGKRCRKSTLSANKFVLDLLIEVAGDVPASKVSTTNIDEMTEALAGWPTHGMDRKDCSELSKLAVIEKAKEDGLPIIGRTTQRKFLLYLKAFFHWCLRCKEVSEDPTRLLEMWRYKRSARSKKENYDAHDLRAVFDREKTAKITNPLLYWGPLIYLFSGMRATEITQLHLDDVKDVEVMDDDGNLVRVMYFDVHDLHEGQRVKSDNAIRKIPVHDTLLTLGFEDYLKDARATGCPYLFPGLPWSKEGPGQTLSAWFNKEHLRKACGIVNSRKTLHCFRHTINTFADLSSVPKSVMRTINGHSDGEDMADIYYVNRAQLLQCKHWINRINYPTIDFLPYEQGRFASAFEVDAAVGDRKVRAAKEGKEVRGRGRPRKPVLDTSAKRKRGRPRKVREDAAEPVMYSPLIKRKSQGVVEACSSSA